jgi:catalase (peroxidase I)
MFFQILLKVLHFSNSFQILFLTFQFTKISLALVGIQTEFNKAQSGDKKVSQADFIVLAGCAGVEQAAENAGHIVKVPSHRDAWTP